ncbi:uncharacterized protein LOC120263143 isoform X2 [Dioscorea cayenensis subsp. rotundata]|uniref:Uncharacterized protein LOC120263143 isoform X2 n=1 Tax=Dioscorea cayennensis subsp. rotundata TaxID=55577 RepID=A0AB40BIV8_DIOCR|nr:uncharacterized protein LOC120263143 isoform X2 [Dioscorea cayenensis subsp. rotundata]
MSTFSNDSSEDGSALLLLLPPTPPWTPRWCPRWRRELGTAEEVTWLPGRLRVHSRCSGVGGESIKKLYQETRAGIRVLEGSVGSPDRIEPDISLEFTCTPLPLSWRK